MPAGQEDSPISASTRPVFGGGLIILLSPGLRMSASINNVFLPLAASSAAKFAAMIDLPSSGTAETMPITREPLPCNIRSQASLAFLKVSAKDERGASSTMRLTRSNGNGSAACVVGWGVLPFISRARTRSVVVS
ncbi:hypothetical protein D9M70_586120 [compost metagenome]